MRLFVAGQRSFGAEVLKTVLASGHSVCGVAAPAYGTRPDKLFEAARRRQIPVLARPLDHTSLPDDVDLIVCAHAHDFIGKKTRAKARHGAIGYHPSLLPLHRGRSAVEWQVRMRERIAGGSVYWLDDRIDGGPVAAQDYCFVRPDDDASELWRRELFPMGLRLVEQVLEDLSVGVMVRVPQDERVATWEPAVDPPPLRRPDLLELGDGTASDLVILTTRGRSRS